MSRACIAAIFSIVLLTAWLPLVSRAEELPDVADYKGQVVVLDFWASWCVPCRRSFPWLNAMHARYSAIGLKIIAVNLDADRAAAEEFLARYPAEFEIVYDPEATLAQRYEIIAMPSSLVFDRTGQLRRHHNGFRVKKQAEYEAAIVAALEGK